MDYKFKTEPYQHQREAFMVSRDRPEFALLMDMGTGKSKVAIDTAAWNYAKGRISAVIIVAPNGVHHNWVRNELPAHLPDFVPYKAATWRSSFKAADKKAWQALWEPGEYLRVFAFNIEAFSTIKGKAECRRILNAFPTMMVLDESHRIKTPGAKRTKALISLGRHAEIKRILTGTAITNSPLDVYAQFKFLSPGILGFNTFAGYKSHFSILERKTVYDRKRGCERSFDDVVGYRNLPELIELVKPHAYSIRKEQCLDLPPKVYETVFVDLTTEQWQMYLDMLTSGVAKIRRDNPNLEPPPGLDPGEELWWYIAEAEGGLVKGDNALTVLLRLQQIIGGWVTDDLGNVQALNSNRLNALLEVIAGTDGQVIVWARFRPEIEAIAAALREHGEVVEYHGGVDNDSRAEGVERFQDGKARFFVGNPHSGGIGITLTAAQTVIYYSNDFSYDARKQSEDRAHRIGQTNTVTYIDLTALGTVDEKIVKTLRKKGEIADFFNTGLDQ